jgi:glycosyltransferase involved in cell wall biosynthesis
MRILYDYQGFNQIIGGVSRYSVELINHLSPNAETILPKVWSDNVYLKHERWAHHSFLSDNKSENKYNLYRALNIAQSIKWLTFSKYDIFHPLFCNPYFVKFVKSPVVVTIHDMNHFKFPDLTIKADIVQSKVKQVCERADAIIAISEETKFDLLKYLDLPENKITVVYHGIEQKSIVMNDSRIFNRPYILYVGARGGYKNFNNFIKGFSLVNKDINLVCTGAPFESFEIELITKLGIKERVFQKFASDEELNNLLGNAIAYISSSIGEGFGIPILEAFRCNCPCIISDLKCFHEVAGLAARYFNPNNPDDIAYVINNTISNEKLLYDMKINGKLQLKNFTWEKTAEKTENVYKNIL